jgi:hypothetical protein
MYFPLKGEGLKFTHVSPAVMLQRSNKTSCHDAQHICEAFRTLAQLRFV